MKLNFSLYKKALLLCALYAITGLLVFAGFTLEYQPFAELDTMRLVIWAIMLPVLVKFAIQLIGALLYPWVEKQRNAQGIGIEAPRVSVLIPAYNEEVGIVKTIRSVLKTNYPDLEVIVINDGSTDNTHQLVSDYIESYQAKSTDPAALIYIQLENGGKARALNHGLQQATGDIIITIDADSVMDNQAIDAMVKAFNQPFVGAVAGNVIVGNRNKPIELLQQLEYLYGFFFRRADSVFNSVYIIGGAAAAYRKSVLDDVGGFDENLITEDIEMSMRILAAGYKTRYAPDAVVYTEGPTTWSSLSKQRLRWKFGRLLTFIKHKQLFFSGHYNHKKYLSWMLLPVALYAELLLLLEGVLLGALFAYTFVSNDYVPMLSMVAFLTTFISLLIVFDRKRNFHRNLFWLAPVAWLLFFVVDVIEFQALVKSLKRLIRGEGLEWQKWQRTGVSNKKVADLIDELGGTIEISLEQQVGSGATLH